MSKSVCRSQVKKIVWTGCIVVQKVLLAQTSHIQTDDPHNYIRLFLIGDAGELIEVDLVAYLLSLV